MLSPGCMRAWNGACILVGVLHETTSFQLPIYEGDVKRLSVRNYAVYTFKGLCENDFVLCCGKCVCIISAVYRHRKCLISFVVHLMPHDVRLLISMGFPTIYSWDVNFKVATKCN